MKPEQAFIRWYTLARYGKDATCEITDGPGDGGIDALVNEGSTRVVIQSKYEPSVALRTASAKDLAAFESLAQRLRDADGEDDFRKWLGTVRKELHPNYYSCTSCRTRPSSVVGDLRAPLVPSSPVGPAEHRGRGRRRGEGQAREHMADLGHGQRKEGGGAERTGRVPFFRGAARERATARNAWANSASVM